MVSQNPTLDFYNSNYSAFIQDTVSADMSFAQEKFAALLPGRGTILDFGCGSGRDTKYFIDKGFNVTATDGCKEFCEAASKYTGIKVKNQLFTELNDIDKYDGVWACSSILHASKPDLKIIFKKVATALKHKGYLYTSFKYGTFQGLRNGRYFTDMTEDSLKELLEPLNLFELKDLWITGDVRPGRENEKWLNVILQKK